MHLFGRTFLTDKTGIISDEIIDNKYRILSVAALKRTKTNFRTRATNQQLIGKEMLIRMWIF